MASTNSYTSAVTETFSRIFGIKNQFKIAFKRIMGYSDKECQTYLDAIKDDVIKYITFWAYSYDSLDNREKWCELTLFVDWEAHNKFLLEGKNEIVMKKSFNGSLPEIGVAIGMIEDAIEEFSITPTFSVGFVDNISSTDYKYYMSKLGLVESKKVEWKAGVKTVFNQTARELPELRAEVNVADLF